MKKNTEQLREMIVEHGHIVVAYKCACATGDYSQVPDSIRSAEPKAVDEIWNALVPMIQATGETRSIEASNTADVLKLLAKGQVTLAEAKDLMHIISTKFEIDDLTSLMDKLEESK